MERLVSKMQNVQKSHAKQQCTIFETIGWNQHPSLTESIYFLWKTISTNEQFPLTTCRKPMKKQTRSMNRYRKPMNKFK